MDDGSRKRDRQDQSLNYADNYGQPWTPEDDALLERLNGTMTTDAMAVELGRSLYALWTHAESIGILLQPLVSGMLMYNCKWFKAMTLDEVTEYVVKTGLMAIRRGDNYIAVEQADIEEAIARRHDYNSAHHNAKRDAPGMLVRHLLSLPQYRGEQ